LPAQLKLADHFFMQYRQWILCRAALARNDGRWRQLEWTLRVFDIGLKRMLDQVIEPVSLAPMITAAGACFECREVFSPLRVLC